MKNYYTPQGIAASAQADFAEATELQSHLALWKGSIKGVADDLKVHRDALHRHIAALGLLPWLNATYPPGKGERAGYGVGAASRTWTETETAALRTLIAKHDGNLAASARSAKIAPKTFIRRVHAAGLIAWVRETYPDRARAGRPR